MEKKQTATKKNQDEKPKQGNTTAKSLKDLFEDGLKDIYWAENTLVKALPKMFDAATDVKLKTAIKDHLDQTKEQVKRLEGVFAAIGAEAEGKKCDAMVGLLEEADSVMEEAEEGAVRDAGIIGAAQKVEHYEIATYGTLAAYAKTLNEREALDLLLKNLGEEKKSDGLLTAIADTTLNSQAMSDHFLSKKIKAV